MEELEKVETEVIQEEPQTEPAVDLKNSRAFKNEAIWLNLRHLGIILSNLSIFVSILVFLIPISTILAFLSTAVLFMMFFGFTVVSTVLTIGFVWTTGIIQEMWTWISEASEKLEFFNNLLKAVPYVAIVGVALCFASAIILQFIKQDRRLGRIIAGYILGVICVVVCILCFAGVFVQ